MFYDEERKSVVVRVADSYEQLMLILSRDSAQLAYTFALLTKDPATEHTIPPSAICLRTQCATGLLFSFGLLFLYLLLATLLSWEDHTA